jgi:hypothetical protein
VELKNAQKRLSHLQRMTCLWYAFNTNVCFRGYVNVATLKFVHICVPSFGYLAVLIRMTDETPLLLAPRDKFDIFDRKFSDDFSTREDWSMECVDLVAPDGLAFFTDQSDPCECRAGAGVFSDILNVRESYALGSHATVFQSEIYAILALSTE